jgi:hypothetical protein
MLFLPELWPKIGLPPEYLPTLSIRLFLLPTILFLGAAGSLLLVSRAYRLQAKQHAKELADQQLHFEQSAAEEKKRNNDFNRPLKIDTRYVV